MTVRPNLATLLAATLLFALAGNASAQPSLAADADTSGEGASPGALRERVNQTLAHANQTLFGLLHHVYDQVFPGNGTGNGTSDATTHAGPRGAVAGLPSPCAATREAQD